MFQPIQQGYIKKMVLRSCKNDVCKRPRSLEIPFEFEKYSSCLKFM